MNRFKKNFASLLFVGLIVFALPLVAGAAMETKTGTIEGLTCATVGYTCPMDGADPMIAVERDFVLVDKSGNFYLMPNLDRGIKARYALKTVTVKGFVDEKYRSIRVEELVVDGKVVWTRAKEREMRQRLEERERIMRESP